MVDHAELKVGLKYQNNLPVDWDEIVPFSSLRHFTCRNLTILDWFDFILLGKYIVLTSELFFGVFSGTYADLDLLCPLLVVGSYRV